MGRPKIKIQPYRPSRMVKVFGLVALAGLAVFVFQVIQGDARRAWQAYLINFLLFSAIAQGAAAVFAPSCTRSRPAGAARCPIWPKPSARFFPGLLFLFLLLFCGPAVYFPLAARGPARQGSLAQSALSLLAAIAWACSSSTGLGCAYLYQPCASSSPARGPAVLWAVRCWQRWRQHPPDEVRFRWRMTVFGILYMLAFAVVLSLLGYDLVMSMDPHWYSTLFGAYCFIKAVYVGFGALIILAAMLHLSTRQPFALGPPSFTISASSFLPSAWCGPIFSTPSSW